MRRINLSHTRRNPAGAIGCVRSTKWCRKLVERKVARIQENVIRDGREGRVAKRDKHGVQQEDGTVDENQARDGDGGVGRAGAFYAGALEQLAGHRGVGVATNMGGGGGRGVLNVIEEEAEHALAATLLGGARRTGADVQKAVATGEVEVGALFVRGVAGVEGGAQDPGESSMWVLESDMAGGGGSLLKWAWWGEAVMTGAEGVWEEGSDGESGGGWGAGAGGRGGGGGGGRKRGGRA
ncbi:minus agglutinin [Gracilaria domingensis]|nr:minus agglutinin [Gracilaria domingensis]